MKLSKREIKEILNAFLLKIHVLPFISALRIVKKMEIDLGHFKSVLRWESIDEHGQPVPWLTYPAIEYIKSLDTSNMKVFEYGSGNSTLFWPERAKAVVAIEHDQSWFEQLKHKLSKSNNVTLKYIVGSNHYPTEINKYKYKFDLIIIDGLFRKKCAKQALDKLSDNGLIILDNSDRTPDICLLFRRRGLTQIDFTGFGPINPYIWTTSLFLSKNFSPIYKIRKHIRHY
jgi:hypothetical protein